MKTLKTLKITLLGFAFVLLAPNILAKNYNTHRSISVDVVPMKHELALKVVPVVRTFVAVNGHIAHVKGADYLVVGDSPNSLPLLKEILSRITLENFDQKNLRHELEQQLIWRQKSNLKTRKVQLNNVEPNTLVAALRALVSHRGNMVAIKDKNQIEITDFPDYLEDIQLLIRRLDQ